ncbi:helix-turn-helix domain-containing protein [Microbispora rosea]
MAQLTKVDGRKLRQRREELELSVDDVVQALAKREKRSIHPDHLRNIELGHKQPGVKLFGALCRVLSSNREAFLADPADAEQPVKAGR